MIKSLTSKLLAAAAFTALTSTMLFAPMQAAASGGQGGVKCYYVLVSFDPATGTQVWRLVCGKRP